MNISVLDCTLRDGGCANGFDFKNTVMREVEKAVSACGAEYIELGYLDSVKGSDRDKSCFKDMNAYKGVFGKAPRKGDIRHYLMIDHGKFDISDLPVRSDDTCDGIRFCFHKKDASDAVREAYKIAEKGYSLFIQPMICTRYNDDEFKDLIKLIENRIPSYSAFYIVDSFGEMDTEDVRKRLLLAESVMSEGKMIGLHTHNNMGLCVDHARMAASLDLKRDLIIDGTLMGMGKGAGNMPLERLVIMLNEEKQAEYDTGVLDDICTRAITPLCKDYFGGQSEGFMISAKYSVTPSYVRMICDNYSPDIDTLEDMISNIPEDKRDAFDLEFAKRFCEDYLARREG